MNKTISTHSNNPQDQTHYLLEVSELTGAQPEKLEDFIQSDLDSMYLGGTTYQYSVWAVRTENGIEVWRTPFDYQGRWVNTKKRAWNKS